MYHSLTEKKVNIGIAQMTCAINKASNIEKAIQKVELLAESGAQIICLQELFASRYFCFEENHAHFALAESIPGENTELFSEIARRYQVVLILSLFERRAPGLYHNTAAVIDADGTYLGKYRKNHIPDDPGFYEKFYFTPGDMDYPVFQTRYAKIGVLICWDQWYPEAARISSLKGAEILFYPTAIGWDIQQTESVNHEELQAWITIQRSHAIANGVHVVVVNRIGQEEDTLFWGNSFIVNPFGTILYQASSTMEQTHVQNLDLNHSDKYRTVWPFLRDRRIDTYGSLQKRFLDE
ncbi:MAG: carbon-nitrogen hydrolase [Microscillaceae bacterium]|nr:carbon-nitrogen hydrolase [Microscillaceae bacterium]